MKLHAALFVTLALACGSDADALGGAIGGSVGGDAGVGDTPSRVPAAAAWDARPSIVGSGTVSDVLSSFASMSLVLSCDGEDAASTTLTCDTGGAFPEAGSGGSMTTGLAAPLTASAPRAFSITASGKHLEASTAANADVATEDIAVEAFFFAAYDGSGSDIIAAKRDDGGTNNGWELALTAATTVTFAIDAGASAQTATCTVQDRTWVHALCFADRDNSSGMRCACNRTLGTATNPTSANGSLTTTDPARIGGNGGAGTQATGAIARVRAWKGSGLAIASYQAQTNARVFELFGLQDRAVGAAAVSYTRASPKFCTIDRDEDGIRRMFLLGSGLPCVEKYTELTGGEYQTGVLIEQASTNLALQSETFGTTWTIIDPIDNYDGNMMDAPDGTLTADKLRCPQNAASRICGATQDVALSSAVRHTFSIYVQKYQPTYFDWAVLRVSTIANTATWFNMVDCTPGTVGSAVVATYIENLEDEDGGDPYCRIGITYLGTVATHAHNVIVASADNDIDISTPGNGNAITVWGAQIENTQLLTGPTSYTRTTTVPVARAVDDVQYTVSLAPPYTIECQGMLRRNDVITGGGHALLVARSSSSHNLAIYAQQISATGRATVDNDPASGGVDASIMAATGDLTDGEKHTVRVVAAATNNLRLYYDGVLSGTPDTSNVPATITRMDAGYWADFAAYSLNGLWGGCTAYASEVLP